MATGKVDDVIYLGHEDILSAEAVKRIRIMVINDRNGEVCVLS